MSMLNTAHGAVRTDRTRDDPAVAVTISTRGLVGQHRASRSVPGIRVHVYCCSTTILTGVAAARCCHRHRTRKTCLLALPLGAVSVLSLTRFGYLSRERCHRWLPVLRGRNRREVSI